MPSEGPQPVRPLTRLPIRNIKSTEPAGESHNFGAVRPLAARSSDHAGQAATAVRVWYQC